MYLVAFSEQFKELVFIPESLSLSCFFVVVTALAMGLAVAEFLGTALGAGSFLLSFEDFLDFLSADFLGLDSLPELDAEEALLLFAAAPPLFFAELCLLDFFFEDF